MRTPSDKTMRRVLIEFTRADTRWKEFALATPGTDQYRELLPFANLRRNLKLRAEIALLRVGYRLLLATKKPKRAPSLKPPRPRSGASRHGSSNEKEG